MGEPVRILIVEDLPTDADLAMREIRKSLPDCEFQRVETKPTFLEALEKFNPDLVLSDYHLPSFTGMEALRLVLEREPLIPLIIYTGSLSEDTAVDCMKAGATNYIIKENLKRLGSAVVHALQEKRVLLERKQAQEALRESEERYRNLLEAAPVGIAVHVDGKIVFTNPAGVRLLGGESEEQIIGRSVFDIIHPDGLQVSQKRIQRLMAGERGLYPAEDTYLKLDGTSVNVEVIATSLEFNGKPAVQVIITDITERKLAEGKIENQLRRLSTLRAIDMAISSTFDLRVILDVLVGHVIDQLHVDAAAVLLLNHATNSLEYKTGRGFRGTGITRLRLKLGEDYAGEAALKHHTVSILNFIEAKRPFSKAELTDNENFVALFAVPLIAKGEVKGVLEVFQRSPLSPDQEWVSFLEMLAGQAAIAIDDAQLFEDLQRSNTDLAVAYDATIKGWSQAMDLRDKETEGHTQRVTDFTMGLARAAGMSEKEIAHVWRGALLHDIGKLGVPDDILFKPGKLTEAEWVIMRKHPQYAYDMLSPIDYLQQALEIPYCHHEKWDGTGYPRGLKGEQIPLAARLFSVVDVWDALRSDRPYRAGWPEEQVLEYIRTQTGTQFDPKAVELFFIVMNERASTR